MQSHQGRGLRALQERAAKLHQLWGYNGGNIRDSLHSAFAFFGPGPEQIPREPTRFATMYLLEIKEMDHFR